MSAGPHASSGSRLLWFEEIDESQAGRVGGKAANLARLTRAGLPVPPGFCLLPLGRETAEDSVLLHTAYERLGSGRVAVRSSATAEDSAEASFAGQQETFLNVLGHEALLSAVGRCRDSIHSAHARAYRERQGIPDSAVAMTVVVQRMVDSDVSGVLFTRDPLDSSGEVLRLEASWGLGEAIVSGLVTPDSFLIDRETGEVWQRSIAQKLRKVTQEGVVPVPEAQRGEPCLPDSVLRELRDLAMKVEEVYGAPQDVEWALAQGRLWLLQARPITVSGAGEREQARQEEIARLRGLAAPQGTVWSRYSLAEVLPEPLPMTWSIVRRFMSGSGGYGLMYRDLGYDPDPDLDKQGVMDLICGRPYYNLSREARIYFKDFPYDYPFAALKADPRKAIYPTPEANLGSARSGFWLRLPKTVLKMTAADRRLKALRGTFHAVFAEQIAPAFLAEVEAARRQPLNGLGFEDLLQRLEEWRRRTLNTFARESLKPSVFAGLALDALKRGLAKYLSEAEAQALSQKLVAGARPTPAADTNHCLAEAAAGRLSWEELLRRVGHRGSEEMELAKPRWRESPEELRAMLNSLAQHRAGAPRGQAREADEDRDPLTDLREALGASAPPESQLRPLAEELRFARTYLGLRESGKHWMMAGYEEIRRCLVEVGRRSGLGDGVFFLEYGELSDLATGADLSELVAERRRNRDLLLSIPCPRVLFSDDLGMVGRPEVTDGQPFLSGAAVASGVVEGPALVARRPEEVPEDAHGFVLVCPSTDPGWSAIFLRARGLVMETGGVLSHGAIVAREFGLPAVVNLPGLLDRIPQGAQLRVDGDLGTVAILKE